MRAWAASAFALRRLSRRPRWNRFEHVGPPPPTRKSRRLPPLPSAGPADARPATPRPLHLRRRPPQQYPSDGSPPPPPYPPPPPPQPSTAAAADALPAADTRATVLALDRSAPRLSRLRRRVLRSPGRGPPCPRPSGRATSSRPGRRSRPTSACGSGGVSFRSSSTSGRSSASGRGSRGTPARRRTRSCTGRAALHGGRPRLRRVPQRDLDRRADRRRDQQRSDVQDVGARVLQAGARRRDPALVPPRSLAARVTLDRHDDGLVRVGDLQQQWRHPERVTGNTHPPPTRTARRSRTSAAT